MLKAALDPVYRLIQSRYDKNDQFVITIDVTQPPYNADPTGVSDAAAVINQAIADCVSVYAGGVVFLPAGHYCISEPLSIPEDVTLKGEYNDPDREGFNGDYGTVLLAKVASTSLDTDPLIRMASGAALNGLTVYYPEQSAVLPKPYPYTVYTGQSWNYVANLTLLNSYKGIAQSGIDSPDMNDIFIQNVKGTVLRQGYLCNNAGDAVFADKLSFSPDYWVRAGVAYHAPEETTLRRWMSENSDCGLYVSGTEGGMFTDVMLDNYKTGIRVGPNVKRLGTEAYGGYLGIRVKNAADGMVATHTFDGMGVQLVDCDFQAKEVSFRNTSPFTCHLFNVTGTGSIDGNIRTAFAPLQVPRVNEIIIRPTRAVLYNALDYGADNTGATDAAPAVQIALTTAEENGGGYVFLPSGCYRFDTAVRVPANTQLCGTHSACIGQSCRGGGTNIFAYYGENLGETEPAMITLAGCGAGVSGIHIYYAKNGVIDAADICTTRYAYAVRGQAPRTYVESVSIYAASHGVDMLRADDFVITRVITCCFDKTFTVRSCQGGMLTLSMQHPAYMTAIRPFDKQELFKDWIAFADTPRLMAYTGYRGAFLCVYDSKRIFMENTFMYHQPRFVYAQNSEVTVLNVFARFTDGNSRSCSYELAGGSITAVCTVYKSCHVHRGEETGIMRIYNANGVGHLSGGDLF